MKKRPSRKTRNEHIYATTVGAESELSISINSQTGEIKFNKAMQNVYSEITYDRKKGPKILSRIPQSFGGAAFDPSDAIAKHYDFLCAVDTNTRIINGHKISVTGIVTFTEAPPPPGASRYWKLDVPFCWEFRDLKVEAAENFGWQAALESLEERDFLSPSMKVGVVVDSDLGNLPQYNDRVKPFFEQRFLPPNVRLIYASADAGMEAITNRVLSVADSVSTQVLNAIENGDVEFNSKIVESPWYEGIRIIHPDAQTYELKF
ncbi:hypothetical protein [Rhizobium sp. LjRoot254]|uniref:hypothetical protein n=1 Tax=Rhizobium sp. LjRoot254 TaxID=3342297 RepID=UPI003ED032EB